MAYLIAVASLVLAVALGRLLFKTRVALVEEQRRVLTLAREKQIVFDFLHDVGEAFTEEVDQHRILDVILGSMMGVTSARGGVIYLRRDAHSLSADCVRGHFPPPVPLEPALEHLAAQDPRRLESELRARPLPLAQGGGIAEVWNTGTARILEGREARAALPPVHEDALRPHSLLLAPLIYRGETLGVLALANPQESPTFYPDDLEIAQSICALSAFSLYHAGVYKQLAEKRQLDHDLALAQEIQRILLPERCPEIPGYSLAATNLPARVVSGDYHDFIRIDDSRWGMVVADVSGKGVPASLVMSICRTILRTRAPGCTSAAELLRRVNRALFPDLRSDMFITMAYLVLDTKAHTVTCAKAGHDAPLLWSQADRKIRELQSPGMVLGIDSGEVFDMVIQDLVVPLEPGDCILLTTDGVHEALAEDGQEFSREPVKEALRDSAHAGPAMVTHRLVENLRQFRGYALQSDDITILSLQRR
jgi:sigma-B regulation protein RsbU (phosphoserine phosphatase)